MRSGRFRLTASRQVLPLIPKKHGKWYFVVASPSGARIGVNLTQCYFRVEKLGAGADPTPGRRNFGFRSNAELAWQNAKATAGWT